ncbi:MAG: peptidylprolyl isomerase [Gammaproteobacteria bacterium]|nr:peptidylprolyl isomerase [Gammaproteobacteria bacterium]
MLIDTNKVVSLHYTLTDSEGLVLDTTQGRGPLTYIHGAGNVIAGLDEGMEGHAAGDRLHITIPPEKAYGDKDDELLIKAHRSQFDGPDELEPGMQFHFGSGLNQRLFVVTEVVSDNVFLDGNHPLAGLTLQFDIEIVDVRDATADELRNGLPQDP